MEIKKIGYPIKRASYTKSLLSRLRAGRSGEAIGTRGGFSPRPDVIAGARCSSPFGPFQRAAPLRAYALATFRSNPPHRSASLHFAHCLRRITGRLLPAILLRQRTPFGNPCKVVFHTVPNPTYDPAAKAMSMFDTSKDLTRLKKELVDEDGKPWLKEADATALIYALRNLDTAYQNFFRGIKKGQDVGFPKFKSRKNPVQTYKSGNVKLAGCDLDDGKAEAAVAEIPSPIPADWDLAGISWNGIVLPKIGKVRARIHRIPEGKFVSCTVERKASGAYYASINVKERELPAYPAATGEVGITFGASHWAVTSDGQVMDLPERIGRLQRRLAIAQRDLARKEPGSQNYLKQKRKVARVNERIADVRKAATHNATRELVNGYGTIAARQMNSKDMQQHGSAATKDLPRKVKKMLNRKMIDGNFAEFNRQLAYKSAWANRSFVEVPGDTPTAQVCSRCGHEELVLARDLRPAWTCSECGAKHDRKANGAQNVLEAGKDILAKQERSFVTKAKKSREKKRATKPISTAREGASR